MPSPASALALRGCGRQTSHEETTPARHLPPCLQTRRGRELRKCKHNNRKKGTEQKIKQLDISSATDHHPPISTTLRRKSAAKFHRVQNQRGLAPGGARRGWQRGEAGSSRSRGSRPSRAGRSRARGGSGQPRHPGNQTRQPCRPSRCFPVPVVLRARKPASAAPRRAPPSSPCPKENATRRCSRSRPRRHQRGVPRRGGWGAGRQDRGSGRSLRAISADSDMRGGQRLRRGIMKQLQALEALLLHQTLRSG